MSSVKHTKCVFMRASVKHTQDACVYNDYNHDRSPHNHTFLDACVPTIRDFSCTKLEFLFL